MKDRAHVDALLGSWERSLKADAKSPATIESYLHSVKQFTDWAAATDHPVRPDEQRRADVQDFIAYMIDTRSTGTAGVRYRNLRVWYRWLLAEDEIDANPMDGMSHPKMDEKVPDVIGDDDLRALLDVTKGRSFPERRDRAIIRLLVDTGMRRGELVNLTVGDVDLDGQVILVTRSKTHRGRLVPIGAKAAAEIDRYLRVRRTHKHADSPALWLGRFGPFTGEGVRQMIKTRCRQARIAEIHPHQFRHTAAHRWLLRGGQEQDLARIAGWTPGSVMLARYGASAAAERAREAHRRIAPGDDL